MAQQLTRCQVLGTCPAHMHADFYMGLATALREGLWNQGAAKWTAGYVLLSV